MAKLTKAQRALLEKTLKDCQPVRPNSSVVRALRVAGYVDFDDQAGNGLWWLVITDAGRAAVARASASPPSSEREDSRDAINPSEPPAGRDP